MPYRYDEAHTPPFPRLPVVISVPDRAQSSVLSGLIDTGADATLAPTEYLRAIDAIVLYRAQLRSHWDKLRTVFVCLVDLEVAGHTLPGVEVVEDDLTNDMLLGRNVLNRLLLLLDGPAGEAEVLANRPRRR